MVKKNKDFKKYAIFGGKRYVRGASKFMRKSDVQKHAIRQRTFLNRYAIIDRNKRGWFVWLKSKPKKKSTVKKTSIPKDFKEKFNSIKKEYDRLNKLRKNELVEIAQRDSRLDISHIKSEDKYSIRNYILGKKFSNKSLEKFDEYN